MPRLEITASPHLGWLFLHDQRGKRSRYAPDLLADPTLRFIDRTFLVWVVAGLALPFGLGYALRGSLSAALTGLLWGGAVRLLVLHHVTFSINSVCHYFGGRRFATEDQSRNLAWLAPRQWARPGTTTIAPSQAPLRMACARWRSTPRHWSSARWRRLGWPGTCGGSHASARRANTRPDGGQ
jgi:stearoyl-CoA desaturase (delta-9 desaturase)